MINNLSSTRFIFWPFVLLLFSQASCLNSNSDAEALIGKWISLDNAREGIQCQKAGDYFELTMIQQTYGGKWEATKKREVCFYERGCFIPVGSKHPFVCKNVNGGLVFNGSDYYFTEN